MTKQPKQSKPLFKKNQKVKFIIPGPGGEYTGKVVGFAANGSVLVKYESKRTAGQFHERYLRPGNLTSVQ